MRVRIGNAKEQIFFETTTNRRPFYRIGVVKGREVAESGRDDWCFFVFCTPRVWAYL